MKMKTLAEFLKQKNVTNASLQRQKMNLNLKTMPQYSLAEKEDFAKNVFMLKNLNADYLLKIKEVSLYECERISKPGKTS